MKKSISVCLPTFNGSLYIEEQLLSILKQIGDDSEVIISDDNSTDDTLEIILGLNDPRIKLFRNKQTLGPVYNMEMALNHANGEIIYMADQDDVWFPDKIKVVTPLMDKYDLVITDAVVTDHLGNILYQSFFKVNFSGKGFIWNWINPSFMGCCMTFNRRILNYCLPFPKNLVMHDSWIGLNTALFWKYCFLNQTLVYYRRHEKNVTNALKKNALPVIYQILYRLKMMYQIIIRWVQRTGSV